MLKFGMTVLGMAIVMSFSAAQAVEVSKFPVELKAGDFVPYHGSNPAFKAGFPTGFGSALTFKQADADGSLEFYALTDRGPNGDAPQAEVNGKILSGKFFPAPDFQPKIALLKLQNGKVSVERTIGLKTADGKKITGLPLFADQVGNTGEVALAENLKTLPNDRNGLDPEGIAVDQQGHFWISDEYGPFAAEFDADGKLLRKLEPGDGLPEILKYRTPNRGAEGLTITPNGTIVLMEQSVLNLKQDGKSSAKTASFCRLFLINPQTGAVKTYGYPINFDSYKKPGNAKLGDIAAINDHEFLIIEQGKDKHKVMQNLIYKVDIAGADDLTAAKHQGLDPEFFKDAGGFKLGQKQLVLNLRQHGWTAEKAEGLTILPDRQTIAVINDNDFGVAVDLKDSKHPKAEVGDYVLAQDGSFTLKGKPAHPKITLTSNSKSERESNLFLFTLDKPLD